MQFTIGCDVVKEGKCKHFMLIAWLVNQEMFLLGVVTASTYDYKGLKDGFWEHWNKYENSI